MTTIYKDERSIRKIVYARSTASWIRGIDRVTKIEAYYENGGVIWFKIWSGDYLYARVNGRHIESIYYGEKR